MRLHGLSLIFLMALANVFFFPMDARADTITVGSSNADFTTIQAAIEAANAGDTIVVAPGTYNENLNFRGKPLVLKSSGGASVTTVTGNSYTLQLSSGESADTVIDGFTISTFSYALYLVGSSPLVKNSIFAGSAGSYTVYATDSALPRFQNVVFQRNRTSYTVFAQKSSELTFDGCTFDSNTANYGGAIYLKSSASATIRSSTFSNNVTANYGGAIYAASTASLQVASSTFNSNSANYGGAVYLEIGAARAVIRDSRFIENQAAYGGAIYTKNVYQGYFSDNVLLGNSATSDGGGFYLYSGTHAALFNNTMAGNEATRGGGIFVYDSTGILMVHNIISDSSFGHGVYANSENVRLLCWYNDVYGNYPDEYSVYPDPSGKRGNLSVDPMYVNYVSESPGTSDVSLQAGSPLIDAGSETFVDADGSPADLGAGGADDDAVDTSQPFVVSLLGSASYHTLNEALADAVSGDTILVGPGVYYGDVNYAGKALTIQSAFGPEVTAISGTSTAVTFSSSETADSVLEGMTVWSQGGYGIYGKNASPTLIDVHVRLCFSSYGAYHHGGAPTYLGGCFEGNAASYNAYFDGGATPTITGVEFVGNRSTNGGALTFIADTEALVSHCLFEDNQATSNYGGAIYNNGHLTLTDSQFVANSAKNGGALYADSSTQRLLIRDSTFFKNSSTYGGALFLYGAAQGHVIDNIIVENEATNDGGGVYASTYSRTAFINDTIVGNESLRGANFFANTDSDTLLLQNIFAYGQLGEGLFRVDRRARMSVLYNDFYENEGGDFGGEAADVIGARGNISEPPAFVDYSLDGDLSNDNFSLDEESLLIDAGYPSFPDTDGSVADLGAGGGDDDLVVSGGDIQVSPLEWATEHSLATAIPDASAGTRIFVYPGVYYGDIQFNGEDIEVKGVLGSDVTVIVGASTAVEIKLSEGPATVLEGFTVWSKGGYGLYTKNVSPTFKSIQVRYCYGSYGAYHYGGAPTYSQVRFEGNEPTYTTYFDGSVQPTISNSAWVDNTSNHGGALYFLTGTKATISGSTFEGNVAKSNYGGAIYLYRSSLDVSDSQFLENSAGTHGGAIYADMSSHPTEWLTIRNSTFFLNQADNGGALYLANGNLLLVDSTLVENESDYGGAAFLNSGGQSALINDTLVGNRAGLGGGLHLGDNTNTLVTNTIIAHSQGAYGINSNSRTSRILVTYSDLYDNEGGEYGGSMRDWTNRSGNVSVDPAFVAYSADGDLENDDLTLRSTSPLIDKGLPSFPDADGTTSDMGAGGGDDTYRDPSFPVYVSPLPGSPYRLVSEAVDEASSGDRIGIYPGVYYGDIDLGSKDVSLEGVYGQQSAVLVGAAATLTADQGEGESSSPVEIGGLSLFSMGAYGVNIVGSHLQLEDCSIRYCYSSYGAYVNGGTLNLLRCTLELNAPSYTTYYTEGAQGEIVGTSYKDNSSANGGAVYLANSTLSVEDSHFLNNRATSNYGGAIYSTSATLSVANTVFQYNTANYGGALYEDSSTLTLSNNAWSYNTGTRHGGAIYGYRGQATVSNSLFAANETSGNGGAAYLYSSEVDTYLNNDFIANIANIGSALYGSGSDVTLTNNIIAHHEGSEAIYLESNTTRTLTYNDFYGNSEDIDGALADPPITNLRVEPEFVDFSDDGNPLNDDYHLADGSPLIDAGDPDILDESDGSVSDIGMYGGAGGPVLDNDGDGFTTLTGDCDDAEDATYPGAWEIADGKDNDCNGVADEPYLDQDGDGYAPYEGDCDDTNPHYNPAEEELCDGIDQDCDGEIDDGVMTLFYLDTDGDGYGMARITSEACSQPSGYASVAGDCNDEDATVKPSAAETCDGKDNNCDGETDEGLLSTYYTDADGDGYGDDQLIQEACSQPSDTALVGGDCDENDPDVNPAGTESCNGLDDDCNGLVDEGMSTTYYLDIDADGYGDLSNTLEACTQPESYVSSGGDCDVHDPNVHPNAEETCDGVDNDCDGVTDEGLAMSYYRDGDGDGYGVSEAVVEACSAPVGYSSVAGDCDDTRAEVKPGQDEVCDGVDNDCDGTVDELVATTYYLDVDSDRYGDSSHSVRACEEVAGYVVDGGDCNDADDTVYPTAAESCNEVDDDCDGSVDEGMPITTYYRDDDGDSYGSSSATKPTCLSNPNGYVTRSGDCDDNNSAIYPGAPELCNNVDDNCNGEPDEGLNAVTYYLDQDGDGYGNENEPATHCSGVPEGYATVAGDCDDARPDVSPGSAEVCDGLDNDCDGQTDEDFDQDSDGALACSVGGTPADCDDTDPAVFPGATELCDGLDNDCDGDTDEVVDDDQDGYTGCDVPADCDDSDSSVYPYAPEVCDGTDNDCDGFVDEGFDRDGDGYYACAVDEVPADCDDQVALINPDAEEVCDGIDNNCDGQIDEGVQDPYCLDADDDQYGDPGTRVEACEAPDDYIRNCTDIDDDQASVYPGAPELPDGLDNDGDGHVDEGTEYYDDDGDGYTEAGDGDCDDRNIHIHPDAPEYQDGRDNDCDGLIDEEVDTTDDDGDGYAESNGDCDDTEAGANPAGTEISDGLDNDCDGLVDEGTETYDDDGDGFSESAGDCDDVYAYTYTGAPEIADGVDNDCDDLVDEDVDDVDDDADGFSEADGDMDDTNFNTYPEADEIVDGLDNNGDGRVDEGTAGGDDDQDGYSENQGDCDDTEYYINPGMAEVQDNGIDDNCDGRVDETPSALPTPDVSLVASSLNFGEVLVGQEATGTVNLVNQGSGGLELASVTLGDTSGVFEALFGSAIIVPPGGSYALWFRFSPSTVGDFSTEATVVTDDPDQPSLTITLSGFGVDEEAEATPPVDGPPDTGDDTTPPSPEQEDTEGCTCSQHTTSRWPAGSILCLLGGFVILGLRKKSRGPTASNGGRS